MFFTKKKSGIEPAAEKEAVDRSDRYIILAVLIQVGMSGLLFLKSREASLNYLILLIPILIVTAFLGTHTYNKDGDMKLFFAFAVLASIGAALQFLVDEIYHPPTVFSPVKYLISFGCSFLFILFYKLFRKMLNHSVTLYLAILMAAGIYALLYFKGVDPNGYGTKAWLTVGPVTFQLTDFTKITALIFYSTLFSSKSERSTWFILVISSFFFALNLAGSVLIHELGSFFILFFLHLSVLCIFMPHSMAKRIYLIAIFLFCVMVVGGSFVLYKILLPQAESGTMNRISTIIWPVVKKIYVRFSLTANLNSDPYGSGYQLLQGKKALWMSGLLGNTVNFSALPVPESDMAFIALASGFGLPLAFFTVLMFLRIFISGSEISRKISEYDPADSVLVYSVTVMLFLQAMIVILGSCNLIPFTGLPIPFLSRGGTYQAIVFSFAGLMISLSQNNGRKYKESEVDPDVTEQLEIPYPGQDQAQ